MTTEATGAIILAAGGSSRLGEPKQFLVHAGETLVRRAALAATAAGCAPIVVVAGDHVKRIREEVAGLSADVFHHPQWRLGIGSSLRSGVAHALAVAPKLGALIIMVCDQPFVTSQILKALIAAHANARKPGIACAYAGTIGVPALFGRSLFAELAVLADGEGAKRILVSRPTDFGCIDFQNGQIDIDTPADLRANLDSARKGVIISAG